MKELEKYNDNPMRKIRKQLGMSQEEFAKALNVARTHISHREYGQRQSRLYFILRIRDLCRVHNLPFCIDDFLEDKLKQENKRIIEEYKKKINK